LSESTTTVTSGETTLAGDSAKLKSSRSGAMRAFRELRRNPTALVGLVLLILLVLAALLADVIAPYAPTAISSREALQPPSRSHWLGTDHLGRDILSRILHGARISLRVGLISVGVGALFGGVAGLISGYYGRWIDFLIMRIAEIMLAFPRLLLALLIAFVLGPTLTNVMIAVGVAAIPEYARLIRGSVLSARENLYVDAARVVGCPDWIIMLRHVLPNVFAPLLVVATLGVAWAILAAASMSYLGMGAQPPTPEWGAMLADGRNYLRRAWWVVTFPGVAIMFTVLVINVVGDGLRDALDPRISDR